MRDPNRTWTWTGAIPESFVAKEWASAGYGMPEGGHKKSVKFIADGNPQNRIVVHYDIFDSLENADLSLLSWEPVTAVEGAGADPLPSWPKCEVCNKPVDSYKADWSPASHTVEVKAKCHGKKWTFYVSALDLHSQGALTFFKAGYDQ